MSSNAVKHILSLSAQERVDFINSFDCVISDCDGVLWTVFEPIAGVAEALAALGANGKTVRYITNNSVRTFEQYSTQFQALGVALQPADIIHPAASVVRFLKSTNFQGLIYCAATEPFKRTLREAGYELLDGPNDPLEESFKKIIATVHDKAPVKAVVVDVDFNLNYPKLLRAELYLKNDQNCLLIGGATDTVLHVKRDFNLLGPGHFLRVLEQASGRKALLLGKPGAELADQVLTGCGADITDPRRVLLVGDMLQQDIAFGRRCGFQTLLVLSGGTTQEDMLLAQEGNECVPDFYAGSFADLQQIL